MNFAMPGTQLMFISIMTGLSELIKIASRTGINGFDKPAQIEVSLV